MQKAYVEALGKEWMAKVIRLFPYGHSWAVVESVSPDVTDGVVITRVQYEEVARQIAKEHNALLRRGISV